MERNQNPGMLQCPDYPVDVVLDTDTFNEVDDQFALAYLLQNQERLRLQAIYAAPFCNEKAETPGEGMEKSYREILKVLDLAGEEKLRGRVYRGADRFLTDRQTPVESAAARDLVRRAGQYTKENPLYVAGIAAATNLASALLLDPSIAERVVVLWLGGSGFHCAGMEEFNLCGDIPAAQVLFEKSEALVQLPCWGVVEHFSVSRPELERYLVGKNPLADYLASYAIQEVEEWAEGPVWTKAIWDVAAVGWILNSEGRFMKERLVCRPQITGEGLYLFDQCGKPMNYVYRIERDALMTDLFGRLAGGI